MIRLQGFRIIKLGQVKNSGWRPLLKMAKTTKETSSLESLGITGYFIIMQIDNPRWPPGAITKKSMNMKSMVEIDPTLCQNVSCMKPF